MPTLLDTALRYHAAGLRVLPADPVQKYPAGIAWRKYARMRPTEFELRLWFEQATALCFLTGAPSGEAEMLDFDNQGELFGAWEAKVKARCPGLVDRLVIEQSSGKGFHVNYRCETPVCGCIKLAQRRIDTPDEQEVTIGGKGYKPQVDKRTGQHFVLLTLIETRGDGGLTMCSPSPGYELLQGDLAALPVLTEAERDILLEAAWELTEYVPAPKEAPPPTTSVPEARAASGARPGDDFNARGDVRAILQKHGWVLARAGTNEYWRRPGLAQGWSATFMNRVFFNHTSNGAPFEAKEPYSPFEVYTLLEHGGDWSAAASALRRGGYGAAADPEPPTGVDLSRIAPDPNTAAQPAADTTDAELTPIPLFHFNTDDDPNNLLGRRWLCRGGSCLLVGQTGLGKSSFGMQAAVTWALGEPLFGLTPTRPLKSLYIQAENDVGDLAEMFQGVLRGINRIDRLQELESRMVFISDTKHGGKDFHPWIAGLIAKHKPDVVWIDPLFSFLKGNVSDQETVSTFLRNGLGAVGQDTGVVWIIVHHANKPARDPATRNAFSGGDYAYLGSGSSELANWARAVLVLREVADNTFELRAAKRGKRAGLIDIAGKAATEIFLQHGAEGICWERSVGPEHDRELDEADQVEEIIAAMELGRPYKRAEVRKLVESIMGAKRTTVLTPGRPSNRVWQMVLNRTADHTNPERFVSHSRCDTLAPDSCNSIEGKE